MGSTVPGTAMVAWKASCQDRFSRPKLDSFQEQMKTRKTLGV